MNTYRLPVVDPDLLAEAAARVRSRADLIEAVGRIDSAACGRHLGLGLNEESEFGKDAKKNILRGGALAWLLLKESVPRFAPDATPYIMRKMTFPELPSPSAVRYQVLTGLRHGATYLWLAGREEESAQAEAAFAAATGDTLAVYQLDTAFDVALGNLRAEDFDGPTYRQDARYGAALLCLTLAQAESTGNLTR